MALERLWLMLGCCSRWIAGLFLKAQLKVAYTVSIETIQKLHLLLARETETHIEIRLPESLVASSTPN